MIKCLIDLVGLKECNSIKPKSGLWINDLPGISLDVIHNMANREQLNYAGVWKSVQERASIRLLTDITGLLIDKKAFRETVYENEAPCLPDEIECINAFNQAFVITAPIHKNALLSIDEIVLYSCEEDCKEVTFEIWDLSNRKLASNPDGEKIEAITVELEPGINCIEIDQKVKTKLVNSCIAIVLKTETSLALFGGCCCSHDQSMCRKKSCCSIDKDNIDHQVAMMEDVPVFGPTHFSPIYRGAIGVKFRICCSIENYICKNKDKIAALWQAAIGKELRVEESVAAPGSLASRIEPEGKKEVRFEGRAQYSKLLKQFVHGTDIDNICKNCDERGYYDQVTMMP